MKGLTLAALIALTVALSPVARAQYTGVFQTNIISGVTSNWSDYYYYVGNTNFADVLLIQNGGVLTNNEGRLGNALSSSNKIASVTGSNSIWRNRGDLYVGLLGSGNSLIVGPAMAGRRWLRTCSAVARNFRPRALTLTQPALSR
jgi:T5SS/PEP-CTERM-associated repeat protein